MHQYTSSVLVTPEVDKSLEDDPGGEWIILLQRLSGYGPDSPPAQTPNAHAKAVILDSGPTHTISVRLVAELTTFSLALLLSWASSGDFFFQLEWSFPSHRFPKFTTRHILVRDGTDLGFVGDLNWALRLFHHFHPSQEALDYQTPDVSPLGDSSCCQQFQQKLPYGRSFRGDFAPPSEPVPWQFVSQQDNVFPTLSASPAPMENCTELELEDEVPSMSNFNNPGSPMSLTTGTTRHSSPDWAGDTLHDTNQLKQDTGTWDIIQTLSQRREEAIAEYTRNGDSSSIFAVLDAAAQVDEAWDPSGFALFGSQRNL